MRLLPLLAAILTTTVSSFSAPDTPRPWKDYRTIMWVGGTVWKKPDKVPLFIQRLKDMGVNTAMVTGDENAKPWLDAGMPYYVENMVNRGLCLKFSSPVTDWEAFIARWMKGGRPTADLVRPYTLNDPAWRADARKRMTDAVKAHAAHAPLAYDIRDELSTTTSANPFDYDFSETSLKGFRQWLHTQYPDLTKLNAQWATDFKTWDEIVPFTTDRIKNRMGSNEALPRGNPDWQAVGALKFDPAKARSEAMRWNFAPWADFRTWMDISLAEALDDLRQTARKLDPATPVGIEGTQMPHAFGGYDLARLSRVLDWVEPYDICNSREIFASFMPGKPVVCTIGEKDARAASRRLWHLRLLGDRGCIVWWSEDCIDWKSDDYTLTKRAAALGPVLKELQSPVSQLFGRAVREMDPIHIHYSQPSIQIAWLMESTNDGSSWLRRYSSYESDANRHAKVRDAWLTTLHDLGWTPVFRTEVDPAAAVTILPQAWALTDKDRAAAAKGIVLTNGQAGAFDEHCTLRPAGPLGDASANPWQALNLRSAETYTATPLDKVSAARLGEKPDLTFHTWVAAQLGKLKPPVQIDPALRVRIHRYSIPNNPARLLALERNISWNMGEDLKQHAGNEALEQPVTVPVTLVKPGHVFDLVSSKKLGSGTAFTCILDPWHPALLAVLPADEPPSGIVERLLKLLP